MKFLEWDKLPEFMKCIEVKKYYNVLEKKKVKFMLNDCLILL